MPPVPPPLLPAGRRGSDDDRRPGRVSGGASGDRAPHREEAEKEMVPANHDAGRRCGPLLPPPSATTTTTTTTTTKSSRGRLRQWLALYGRLTASASHQDKLLKLLQWSCWMLSHYYGSSSSGSSRSSNHRRLWWYALYTQLTNARYATRLLGLPVAVEAALYGTWTVTPALGGGSDSDDDNHQNHNRMLPRAYAVLGKVLAYSMVAYHPAEAAAFVLWNQPPLSSPSTTAGAAGPPQPPPPPHSCGRRPPPAKWWWYAMQSAWPSGANAWSYLSCRCWLVYVVAELVQCGLRYHELRRQRMRLLHTTTSSDGGGDDDDDDDKDYDKTGTAPAHHSTPASAAAQQQQRQQQRQQREIQSVAAEVRHTLLQGARDALFVLPCVQWSLPHWDTRPWLPTPLIHALLWAEAAVSLIQAADAAPAPPPEGGDAGQ